MIEGRTAAAAQAWRLRLIRQHDRYGPQHALRHMGGTQFVEFHPEHGGALRRCARRSVEDLHLVRLGRPVTLDAREGWVLQPAQTIALLGWLEREDAAEAFLTEDGMLHARRSSDARRARPRLRSLARAERPRRWDEPRGPEVVEEMIDALIGAGPAAHAGDPECEALMWLEGRFAPEEAEAWIIAGVEDAGAAADLRDAGLQPEQAVRIPAGGTLSLGGHLFDGGESIADAYRSGTISITEAVVLRSARRSDTGTMPLVFPAGTWT